MRVLLACLFLSAPAVVSAQELIDPLADEAEAARFHFGPLAVTPALEIRQVGVDTNVFNTADDAQRDFTAAIGPRALYWFRAGRLRIRGESGLAYYYFREFAVQRALGTENELKVALPLNRVTPFVIGEYTNTQQRPDYEIDARIRTRTTRLGGGLDLKAGSRTLFTVHGEEGRIRFDDEAFYFGSNLRVALERKVQLYRMTMRQRLTPLTTFVVMGDRQNDRFEFQPNRDADSYQVLAGFELDPRALISGEALVGFRSFTTTDLDVPDFEGVVVRTKVAYILRATRIGFAVQRDTAYSFEVDEPFFVATDLLGEVTQKVTSRWDIVGRLGRQTLSYKKRGNAPGDRTDIVWTTGGGIGRRVGRTARVGVDLDRVRRDSPVAGREYEGWRIGGSLTYGVQSR
jgi:hypothetical protein